MFRSRLIISLSFSLNLCPFDDIWRDDQMSLEAIDQLDNTSQFEAFCSS